jgi:hypothetical protein
LTTGLCILRWVSISALSGALGGGIYGILFAGFAILLRAEAMSVSAIAGYFAVCGVVAGAILGTCRGLQDETEMTTAQTEPSANEISARVANLPETQTTIRSPVAPPEWFQHRNRITVLSRGDRRNSENFDAKNPSRN